MAAAELRIVGDRLLPDGVGGIERVVEGRTPELRFEADCDERRLAAIVGQLCASAALFRQHRPGRERVGPDGAGPPPDGPLLRAVPIVDQLVYGTELVSTQRYRGKTNERLTRAMLNIALAVAGIDIAEPAGVVLDPMCGRGTTLNWALAYGLDAIGIEADRSSLDHHGSFLETWAKRNRLPHKALRHRANNAEHRLLSFEVAPDRATLESAGQRIQTFCADAGHQQLAIKRRSVDVVVVDLPYGVQHGGRSSGGTADADTAALLKRLLPTWRRWLRPGGALCLAWNARRAERTEICRLLKEAGFDPVIAAGGYSMRHAVDAAIDRDVVVAGHRRAAGAG